MIVVYGQPETYSNPQYNNSYNVWDDCIQFCAKESSCVLAYDNAGMCEWFDYKGITKVKQGSKSDGEKVAFKINNITTSTCPSGINPPTFNNENAMGWLLIPGEWANPIGVNYTISYASGFWQFTYTAKNACPDDFWVYIPREGVADWCMSTEVSDSSVSYTQAVQNCATYPGGILTGARTIEESKWFVEWGIQLQDDRSVESPNYTMRIDGKRKTECETQPGTSACGNENGFIFMDQNAATLDYYSWVTGVSARAGADSDCFVITFVQGKIPMIGDKATVDVQSCTSTALPAYSYLCATEAWQDWGN